MSNVNKLHGGMIPVDVRETSISSVSIRYEVNGKKTIATAKVWQMSPIAIEVTLDSPIIAENGIEIEVSFSLADRDNKLTAILVEQSKSQHSTRAHLRFVMSNPKRIENAERRTSSRFICSEDYFPVAVATNPVKFNDFIYFKVRDISYGGLKLHTSLRNNYILGGMKFDALLNLPMTSQIRINFEVVTIKIELVEGKEVLVIGAKFDPSDVILRDAMSNYLIQFSNVESPNKLESEGFKVKRIGSAVDFSYSKTKEEFEQVLNLRCKSYIAAGKVSATTKPSDMSDVYDSRSRIVVGKFKSQVVSTARIVFHNEDDQFDQEKYVSWPAELPRREESVEIMRVCTEEAFRGRDLLLEMFRFIAITVAQSKRRWIVISATESMVPLYKKIGFSEVGLSYPHTELNNIIHHVLIADVPSAMTGKNVSPLVWNLVWAPVTRYLEQYGFLTPDPLVQLRLAFYRAMGPVARLMQLLPRRHRQRAPRNGTH